MDKLKESIRNVPDFPKPGIQFKDITPLLKSPGLLEQATRSLVQPFLEHDITAVAGMEARGFIFGSLCARELGVSFVPLRKPGKLPYESESVSYELEYGEAELEIHADALSSNDRVLLVDDLIATGGTALASCALVEKLGATVAGCAFLVELDELNGKELLANYEFHSVIHF